jgi:hypothetical protein
VVGLGHTRTTLTACMNALTDKENWTIVLIRKSGLRTAVMEFGSASPGQRLSPRSQVWTWELPASVSSEPTIAHQGPYEGNFIASQLE